MVTAYLGLLTDVAPTTLQTDKGLKFMKWFVKSLLKEHGIHHFYIHNEETKASVVEKCNRTLKTVCYIGERGGGRKAAGESG